MKVAERVANVLAGKPAWSCNGTRCVDWCSQERCNHEQPKPLDGRWFCTLKKGHHGDHIGCVRDSAGHGGHPAKHNNRIWPRKKKHHANKG